jgi:diguanylate cyclase (GGDEF)-like protein
MMRMSECKTKGIHELLSKALQAEHHNTELALDLSYQALAKAKECDFLPEIGMAHMRIGRCFWTNGDFEQALEHLDDAIEIATKVNDYVTKAEALNARGNVYVTMELFDQAVSEYHLALNLANEHQLLEQESKLLNNLGTLHEELGDNEVALDYYRQSLEKAIDQNDEYGEASAHVNMANVYLSMGDLIKTEDSILKAVDYGIPTMKTLLLAHAFNTFGRLFQEKKEYDKSIDLLKTAITKAVASKDLNILSKIYLDLGYSYQKNGDHKNAETYYLKSLELTEKIGIDEFLPRVYEYLTDFYEDIGDKEKAQLYYKKFFHISKVLQEHRREERVKSVEIRSKLKNSLEETEIYRNLSQQLRKSYEQMHIVSRIGQTMTSTHRLNSIFNQLYENINDLMAAKTLAVGFYDEDHNRLNFNWFIENDQRADDFSLSLDNKKSWMVYSFLNKETLRINDIEKEYKKHLEGYQSSRGELMYSAMYAPLIVYGEAIGVMSIQTKEKNAYTPQHEVLMETLASYLAIAIKNALRSRELAVLNRKLKDLSEQDGLTGIPNRRLFDETYQKLWLECMSQNTPLTMMMIDVDYFKRFNDDYGHLLGDDVIKAVANHLMKQKCHNDDFIGRFGGDEFIMLCKHCHEDQALEYAKRIKASFKEMNKALNIDNEITLSYGLATTLPTIDKSQNAFLDFVDEQLYISKKNGRNKITYSNQF